jgi:hypothetical protein
MEQNAQGEFSFKITKPIQSLLFHVEANGVLSPDYELNVKFLHCIDFENVFTISYLNKKSEIIKGTKMLWFLKVQLLLEVEYC